MGSLISRIAISVLRFFHLAPLPEIEQSESSSPSALPPAMQTKSVVRRKYVAEEVTVTNTENHPLIEKATDEFESDCFNRLSSCQDPCGTSLLKTDEASTFREITSTNQASRNKTMLLTESSDSTPTKTDTSSYNAAFDKACTGHKYNGKENGRFVKIQSGCESSCADDNLKGAASIGSCGVSKSYKNIREEIKAEIIPGNVKPDTPCPNITYVNGENHNRQSLSNTAQDRHRTLAQKEQAGCTSEHTPVDKAQKCSNATTGSDQSRNEGQMEVTERLNGQCHDSKRPGRDFFRCALRDNLCSEFNSGAENGGKDHTGLNGESSPSRDDSDLHTIVKSGRRSLQHVVNKSSPRTSKGGNGMSDFANKVRVLQGENVENGASKHVQEEPQRQGDIKNPPSVHVMPNSDKENSLTRAKNNDSAVKKVDVADCNVAVFKETESVVPTKEFSPTEICTPNVQTDLNLPTSNGNPVVERHLETDFGFETNAVNTLLDNPGTKFVESKSVVQKSHFGKETFADSQVFPHTAEEHNPVASDEKVCVQSVNEKAVLNDPAVNGNNTKYPVRNKSNLSANDVALNKDSIANDLLQTNGERSGYEDVDTNDIPHKGQAYSVTLLTDENGIMGKENKVSGESATTSEITCPSDVSNDEIELKVLSHKAGNPIQNTDNVISGVEKVENTENPQESSVNQSESCTKEIHAVRKVTWKGEADRVEVTGSWVDWDKLIPLQLVDPEENIWQSDIPLSSSNDDHSVEMKFVVDSEWLTSADMATVTNGVGTMNNVIYLDREE
uniref:5'-AMP-activated protein kinase subunit beta-1 n=1 Tax=Phallusia mammillata TaxID=59560 RepID=A0A6F9DNZ6_9ASCI|nr:5'-AMP-activated protein kinase subunit beta-1 [Phallusia mammillata]